MIVGGVLIAFLVCLVLIILIAVVYAWLADPDRIERAARRAEFAEQRRVLERQRALFLERGTGNPSSIAEKVSELDDRLIALAKEEASHAR